MQMIRVDREPRYAGSGNIVALAALPLFCLGSFLGSLIVPLVVQSTPYVPLNLTKLLGVEQSVAVTLAGY